MEDCTLEWTFPPEHFDFIHIRGLVGSIDDWHVLFQRAFTCLKPGGWLESYEINPSWESDDNTVAEKSAMGQWGPIFIEGGRQSGRSFTIVPDGTQQKAMEAAGFQDIQEKKIKVCPRFLFLPLYISFLFFYVHCNRELGIDSLVATNWVLAQGQAAEGDRHVWPTCDGKGCRRSYDVYGECGRLVERGDHGLCRKAQAGAALW
jgi:hypothetical protein